MINHSAYHLVRGLRSTTMAPAAHTAKNAHRVVTMAINNKGSRTKAKSLNSSGRVATSRSSIITIASRISVVS